VILMPLMPITQLRSSNRNSSMLGRVSYEQAMNNCCLVQLDKSSRNIHIKQVVVR
jgi:hypothetical protein